VARSESSGPGPRSSADRLGRVVAPGDQGWSASLHFIRAKDSPEPTDSPILPGFGLSQQRKLFNWESDFAMRNKDLRQRGEVID